jgi:hypothetical protein
MPIEKMTNRSIRKLTKCEARDLARVMGYNDLDEYIDRWCRITIESPNNVRGVSGTIYKNQEIKEMKKTWQS